MTELLLKSSQIFANHDSFDCIHQSYIDLYCEKDEEDVRTLLKDAISYLEKDIKDDFTSEIFSLIIKCFSIYPKQFLPLFNAIFENSRTNSNYLIITTMLLSYFLFNIPDLLPNDYNTFVDDAINEIIPQITKSEKDHLFVFNNRIPFSFKSDLITNLILLSKPTEQLLTNFANYLPLVFTKLEKYPQISDEKLSVFIPFLSKDYFSFNFPEIDKILNNSEKLSRNFVINVLQKCQEYDIKIKSVDRIFYFINLSDLTPEICDYLKRLNFFIPDDVVQNFIELPDYELLVKCVKSYSILPEKVINDRLMNSKNSAFFNRYFIENSKHSNPILLTREFFLHFYQIAFQSGLYRPFSIYIQNEKFIEFIDEMIFTNFPPDERLSIFLENIFQYLSKDYLNLFYSDDHIRKIILNMINEKVIPNYKFIQFLNSKIFIELIQQQPDLNSNPFYLYGYFFCQPSANKPTNILQKITVLQPIDYSNDFFIKFIQTNDLNLLQYLKEDTLSLVICALIYSKFDNIEIEGLNEISIIPFYTILFRYCIPKNIMQELFYESSTKLVLTPYLIELFEKGISYYLQNDTKILSIFIELNQSKTLFPKQQEDLHNFREKIFNMFVKIASIRISYDKRDFYIKVHKLSTKQFLISDKIDELLYNILSTENLEIKDDPIQTLFENMLTEKSCLIRYLEISFETLRDHLEINLEDFLKIYYKLYSVYKLDFIDAIGHLLVYVPSKKVFVKNFVYLDNCDHIFTKGDSIVSKLIEILKNEPENYNAFFCLKSIACTFPFLLDHESNPQEILQLILSALNNYSIIFDDQFDNDILKIKKLKTAISAYSFLISSLHSTKIIDTFINFFFTEMETFTDSQLFCFISVLQSILETPIICLTLMSYFIKYKFFTKFSYLLDRNISNEKFNYHYIKNLYNLFTTYINNAYKFDLITTISIYSYYYADIFFQKKFKDLFTIFPSTIKSYQSLLTDNKDILDYIQNIEKLRSFWIHPIYDEYSSDIELSSDQIDTFLIDYKSKNPDRSSSSIDTQCLNYCCEVLYYAVKPYWIERWFLYNDHFPVLKDHADILNEIIEAQLTLKKKYKISKFDKYYFYEHDLQKTGIYEQLFEKAFKISSFDDEYEYIKNIFQLLYEKEFFSVKLIYRFLYQTLDQGNELKIDLFTKLFSFIMMKESLSSKTITLYDGDQLINKMLKSQFRTNINLLNIISKLLNPFNFDSLSIRITHLIGFMIISENDEIVNKSLQLCESLDNNKLKHMPIFQELFDHEIAKEKPSSVIISIFVKKFTFVVLGRQPQLLDLLTSIVEKPGNDSYTRECILYIFNFLTPKRISSNTISFSNSIHSVQTQNDSIFYVPEVVYNSFPDYWNFFVKYILKIKDILSKKDYSTLKVFTEYPEFVDFKERYNKFCEKMANKLHNFTLRFTINPDDILDTSYKSLFFKNDNEWLKNFRVEYVGNRGIDFGGLTRDFFTKLTNEFANPNKHLFISFDENMCFQPDASSEYEIPRYESYYKFAGKIIARSILQGLCINVQFTRAFLKQILGREVGFNDLESSDSAKFTSLKQLIDNDIDNDPNEYYFEVNKIENGKVTVIELIENGSNIRVTNENKEKYAYLIAKYHLFDSIQKQIAAFKKGFYSFIPLDDIKYFTSGQLNLVISGVPEIDLNDFRENIKCEDSNLKNLFFDCIANWSNEDLALLILFITGTSRIPPIGFSYFGIIGNRISISPTNDTNLLPVAHTCFNKLDLPRYSSKEIMNQKLRIAISECDSFQLS